jgi:hypothetical protein
MKKPLSLIAVTLAALTTLQTASAHISYTGRNLGTWSQSGGLWSVTANSGSLSNNSVLISLTNIASDFGWADATDSDYGDSHKGRWFSFTLTNPGTFSLAILGGGTNSGTQAGVYPFDTSGPQFLPAYTIYRGLAVSSAHDGSNASITWRAGRSTGSEGALNTLGNFSIGNDVGEIGELAYVGHVADGTSSNYGSGIGIQGDGNADGSIAGTFALSAGTYSVFVGGANYNGVDTGNYGAGVTLGVVPEPSTYALLGFVVVVFALVNRRRITI